MNRLDFLCVALGVLLGDQASKILLHRFMGPAVTVGPFCSVQLVAGRLWLQQFGKKFRGKRTWWLWTAGVAPLILMSLLMPSSAVFVGLMLGGSLSNVIESSTRGYITDYVCLRFWPAFNLADAALVVGAIGLLRELLLITQAMLS
jgi:signal peptidase II